MQAYSLLFYDVLKRRKLTDVLDIDSEFNLVLVFKTVYNNNYGCDFSSENILQ